jgi:hypothetical protein
VLYTAYASDVGLKVYVPTALGISRKTKPDPVLPPLAVPATVMVVPVFSDCSEVVVTAAPSTVQLMARVGAGSSFLDEEEQAPKLARTNVEIRRKAKERKSISN